MNEKKLLTKELYDCTYGAEWTTLEKIKEREKDNYIKFRLEEALMRCGCFHHCECRREKLIFVGKRLETDEEFANRLLQEKTDLEKRKSDEEKQKRYTYEQLKKEFEI